MSSVKKSKKITEDVQAETGDMNKYPRHQESKEFMVTMLNAEGRKASGGCDIMHLAAQ